MIRRASAAIGLLSMLTLAACGGGSQAAPPAPSAAVSAPAAELACAPTGDSGTVAVTIKDFAFSPAAITATVGDIVGFTNEDGQNHTATLDEGDCGTESLATGSSGGLIFSKAGTYPFHCAIHPNMTGTITVTE
jgi:plastocyanin